MKILALALAFSLLSLSYCSLSNDYQNSVQLDDLGKTYMLYWTNKPSDGMMHFAVEVKTTGWVAFGFANKIGMMKGYDVMISYITDGNEIEFNDYLTNGRKPPTVDSSQDYYLVQTGTSQVNGTTTVRFKRKLNTGDDKDIVIKPGKMWVVWAYRKYDNINQKHDKRGFKEITLFSGGTNTRAAGWVLLLTGLFIFSFQYYN